MISAVTFSVFTKPWRMPLPELGAYVRALGFEGIELPVRPGYPIEPEHVDRLPEAAHILANEGIRIDSVAGPTDEPTIAACAEAGVPLIRTMTRIGPEGYLASVARAQDELDALLPMLQQSGVRIGVQNHCGSWVNNAMGLRHLLTRPAERGGAYDPRQVCAVWDAAHNALNGEDPEPALDILWDHLGMVNLKNALWRRTNGPEAVYAEWQHYWTSGRHGLASWPRVAAELQRRGYRGVICLTAEYSDQQAVDRLIREDLALARSLF